MRVGTWNLEGKWDKRHAQLMEQQKCDVWLLTEVSERFDLPGFNLRHTSSQMSEGRWWAAVLSKFPLVAYIDPHPASALAKVGDMMFCSSILPWRSCGGLPTWEGERHADKTRTAVDLLLKALPKRGLIWGGDWNHALAGKEYSGSQEGRTYILEAVAELNLKVQTAALPHRLPDLLSIDHIAVGRSMNVFSAERIVATDEGKRLSDHDAYVLEIEQGSR